jgi:hypothetical protein
MSAENIPQVLSVREARDENIKSDIVYLETVLNVIARSPSGDEAIPKRGTASPPPGGSR